MGFYIHQLWETAPPSLLHYKRLFFLFIFSAADMQIHLLRLEVWAPLHTVIAHNPALPSPLLVYGKQTCEYIL